MCGVLTDYTLSSEWRHMKSQVIQKPVVVILGNIVVICLEALLSAIQGIRLEFYEMFSRCYKGGGRKFVAFDLKKAKA